MAAATAEKPTPNLDGIDTLEKGAAHCEQALLRLVQRIKETLAEAESKGSRAADLIALYRRVYDAQEAIVEATKPLTAMRDLFKYKLLPEAYERENTSTLTTSERDRVTITQAVRASILAENRGSAYAWLREHGHGQIIQETVNASTLSAWAKAELEENHTIPEVIKVDVLDTASLTRGKKLKE